MCIVCLLWEKEKITAKEGKRALWEQASFEENEEDIKHMQEIYARLDKADREPE